MVAIYIHAPVNATVDGTKPAGCVTAGSAKMPAPTVVPATSTIAFLGQESTFSLEHVMCLYRKKHGKNGFNNYPHRPRKPYRVWKLFTASASCVCCLMERSHYLTFPNFIETKDPVPNIPPLQKKRSCLPVPLG